MTLVQAQLCALKICARGLIISYCGNLLSPAILISRLLLRMRRVYVASIRLDIHSFLSPEPPRDQETTGSGDENDFQ